VSAAVFGDFLAAASGHLKAAMVDGSNHASSPEALVHDLYRLVTVLTHYCDDLAPCDQVEALSRNDLHPWERAAVDAAEALRVAADCLQQGTDRAVGGQSDAIIPHEARHLVAAARELAAGRDLLHTHLSIDSDGRTRARSEWAPVVTSVPVTRALANEITRWSRVLAPFTALLAHPAAWETPSYGPVRSLAGLACAELASASQWLHVAGAAARPALEADPAQAADTDLLSAIPSSMVAPRSRPSPGGESVAELCHGITISASRLRRAMQDSQDRARWSPSATSGGWQWMAQAAAITSHLSELALRAAGTRADQFASPPASEAQLNNVADLMAAMRAAWSQVDQAWDAIITETRLIQTPAMTDASDLLLRMGRLVWDDPQWTPARSRRAPPRAPAALAPQPAAITDVVAAVHHAVDAIAHVARSEIDAVQAAGGAGRLYVPTRSLPAECNVPRPFTPAPTSQRRALIDAYRAAYQASLQVALELDGLAVAPATPSRVLALARAAASVQSSRPRVLLELDYDHRGDALSAGAPFRHSRASTGQAGPVERAIRDRPAPDPFALPRAAAIDNAAHQLIAEAEGVTKPASNVPGRQTNRQRASPSAAQLAAQSFPNDLRERPPEEPPSRSAGETASVSRHSQGLRRQVR